ncbi:hypothetical protein SprV_0602118200 [Sparganum proliferum]
MGKNGTKLLQRRVAERTRKQRATRKAAPENKFRKLPALMSSKKDKPVHNLSSKEQSEEQIQVLRREASSNTADAKPANMIAAVESILSQTGATDETKNLTRHQVCSLLMTHRPRDGLSKVERDALKELRAGHQILAGASVCQERFGSCRPPSRTTWGWSCTQTGGNHQASVNETKRPAATARNVWRRLSDLVQLRTKQLRRRNRKTTPNENGRRCCSGAEK